MSGFFDRLYARYAPEVGVDLGTANTPVFVRGEGVRFSEPSMVAIDTDSGEIITVGPASYRLPGLGSFLWEAAEKGHIFDLVAGLLTLLAIIVVMDLIVWQPLSTWSEKFRYEFAASPEAAHKLGMFDALSGVGPAITRALRIPGAGSSS